MTYRHDLYLPRGTPRGVHQYGDLLPHDPGVLDQGMRSIEIRGGPRTAVRLKGVWAERLVALEARREYLARQTIA